MACIVCSAGRGETPNGPHSGSFERPAYSAASDVLLNFTQDGPKTMPDPWKVRLDLTAARKD